VIITKGYGLQGDINITTIEGDPIVVTVDTEDPEITVTVEPEINVTVEVD
jgi:hypothetical protein